MLLNGIIQLLAVMLFIQNGFSQFTYSLIQTMTLSAGNIHGCAISANKFNVIAAQFDAIGRVYQIQPGTNQWQSVQAISSGSGNQFFEVDISNDNKQMILGGTNGITTIYLLNSGGTYDLMQTLPTVPAQVWTVRFTNDKSFLSVGANNGYMYLWKRNNLDKY